jgi:hypothetical protein
VVLNTTLGKEPLSFEKELIELSILMRKIILTFKSSNV